MIKIIVFLAAISGSLAITNYNRCSEGEPFESLLINLCNEAPCTFFKGDQIIANAVANVPYGSVLAIANLDLIIAGTRTKYPLPVVVANACAHMVPTCPLLEGMRIEYTFDMEIKEPEFGGVPMTMELQIKDFSPDRKNMFCVSFTATVHPILRP